MNDVYEPAEDTLLLIDVIDLLEPCEVALEVGSGSGIVSVKISEKASYTISTDIDLEACRATLKRLRRANAYNKADVVCCDLLTAFRHGNLFNLIAFNPPYLPDEGLEDRSIFGGEGGIEISLRLIEQAYSRLHPNGRLIILLSSLSDVERLLKASIKLGFVYRVVKAKELFFEKLIVFEFRKT